MTKAEHVRKLLASGLSYEAIAERVGCALSYVSVVKRNLKHGRSLTNHVYVPHVNMVIGPWLTDRYGNRYRQIRGT